MHITEKTCAGSDEGESVLEKRRMNRKLVEAFDTNVELRRFLDLYAAIVVKKLRSIMQGIEPYQITPRMSNALRKFLKDKKQLSLSALEVIDCTAIILCTNSYSYRTEHY